MKRDQVIKIVIFFGMGTAACRSVAPLPPPSFPAARDSTEQESPADFDRAQLQSVLAFLSSDLLEGRAPGTRGGSTAELYLQSLFQWMGLQPGHGARFLQPLPLKAIQLDEATLEASGIQLALGPDLMGSFVSPERFFAVQGPAVFVGFGIQAERWNWDDFKGADLKGKFLIARVNDPGTIYPEIFEGKTLTYYGRWTYHLEEAARRGAVGMLLIHTDESAGYGWDVVQNSWEGESLYLPEDLDNGLKFRGWIREAAFRKLMVAAKQDPDGLLRAAQQKTSKPVDLGFGIRISGKSRFREVTASNVVAEIPGRSKQRIVLSAHIDHLGMKPGAGEDRIYNGAIDNASAVAALVMTARLLQQHQKELFYTVTVLACQAEEAGLLGSEYFVKTADRENLIAAINFEATPVWKRAKSLMGIGAEYSTLDDTLQTVATQLGVGTSRFSLVNQGLFYRSDQFSFARYGIPSLWISAGEDDLSGERPYTRFWSSNYHTVRDEYDPQWDLGALRQTIQAAVLMVQELNRSKARPSWKYPVPFPMEKQPNP